MTTSASPAMIRDAGQLPEALTGMADEFPDIHDQLTTALGACMRVDGTIEFRVTDLARRAKVPFGQVKIYLRSARQAGLLHLLGRRLDSGEVRYCAYQLGPQQEAR